MRYRTLFNQSPIYYQLAKQLSQQVDVSRSVSSVPMNKEQQALIFFTVNLLGQCDVNGHAALNLNEYSQTVAFNDRDIDFQFPDTATWLENLENLNCIETLHLSESGSSKELTASLAQLERSDKPLCLIVDVLYLAKTAFIELALSLQLIERAELSIQIAPDFIQSPLLSTGQFDLLNTVDSDQTIDWQMVAVNNSLLSPLSIIVGGPGTGKTTTVAKIVESLFHVYQTDQQSLHIAFAAPTGKAAARLHSSLIDNLEQRLEPADFSLLSESLPESAKTLHRLLGWHGGKQSFEFNQNNQLPYNCLIVDEVSMIDTSMFYYLLRAVKPDCRLILLGDPKQLASVQSGSVLSDLCHHDALMSFSAQRAEDLQIGASYAVQGIHPPLLDNIAFLRKSYRFDEHSAIGRLAKICQAGDVEAAFKIEKENSEGVSFLDKNTFADTQSVIQMAMQQHTNLLGCESAANALACLTQFQILCVKREGDDSVAAINQMIAQRLNLKMNPEFIQGVQVYHGMPIIIEKNLYQQGLFNGDVGIAWRDDASGELQFYFSSDGQSLKHFMPNQLSGWQSAHAMTVHKSQGSEYDAVVLWMPEANSPLLNKELFYTAVTRAKQSFICLTDKAAVKQALATNTVRFSKLTELLRFYSSS